jgi:16S rRNA (uracil1498-N3)-methyltransferase
MPPRPDFTSQRLFLDQPLAAGAEAPLGKDQANYLLNVLRMKPGDGLLVFNGRDGEWRAEVASADRRRASIAVLARTRLQPAPSPITLAFAPLKQARLDYMVQKAVEMGAGRLVPVQTQRTQVSVKNVDRLRANIIEAAEQCGVLAVPELLPETKLARLQEVSGGGAHVVFCDETDAVADPAATLRRLPEGAPVVVLIGPEGGFTNDERAMIRAWPRTVPISLGPRILRADTAAVAALAAVQMAAGDWRAPCSD